jgi:hypothetical protein
LAVGASAGAINAKTHHKWICAFSEAIAKLVKVAVNIYFIIY